MAAVPHRADHYILQLWFLSSSFFFIFLTYSQPSQIGCLPYIHTWCSLSANLECRSEMCCTQLAEIQDAKIQYLLHMSLQYDERRPTSGWDRLVALGHPSKFQRVSCLGFVTAPTSLNGNQPNLSRCWPTHGLVKCIYFFGGGGLAVAW